MIISKDVNSFNFQTFFNHQGTNIAGRPGFYDYSMVNVAWCSNLEVIEEPNESPESLSNLNIQKVKLCFNLF